MVQSTYKCPTERLEQKYTSLSGDSALSHVADKPELYVTQHVQSVFRPSAKWTYRGAQIDAGGVIGGQPGGDFYIAALGPHNEVSLAVGTVTGGGSLPTLCKVLIASLIHLQARLASPPIVVLRKVNSLLREFDKGSSWLPVLCSMFVVLINRKRETFEYSRAGSCHPLVQTRQGKWLELPPTCPILGCAAEADTDAHALILEADEIQRLAVITDGCTTAGKETRNVAASFISSIPHQSASRQVHAMLAKICRERRPDACPGRDASVVVVDLPCNAGL